MCADVFSVFVFVALIQESEGVSWIYWPLANGVVLTNLNLKQKKKKLILKGHCHGDFSVCWTKQFKYLTKNPFLNVKSLLEKSLLQQ